MKVGLFVATQFTEGTDLEPQLDNLLAQVRAARENCFESVIVAQHFLTAPMQMFQTVPTLARLAAEARGMTMGPGIMLLPMLNPVVVAEEAATLDWITGGNYVLAVGMGYRQDEFDSLGVPFKQRVGRFTEYIEVIRKLWTEDRVTYDGKYVQLKDVGISVKPKRPGGVPIWVGGAAEPAIQRAARIGDTWFSSMTPPIETLVPQVEVYNQALREFGRSEPVERPLGRECYVGASNATALDECRGPLLYKYQAYASWGNTKIKNEEARFERDFDEFVKDRFIVGDEAAVRDEIVRYRELLGFDHFIMRMQWPGLAQEMVLASIERLGRVVASIR